MHSCSLERGPVFMTLSRHQNPKKPTQDTTTKAHSKKLVPFERFCQGWGLSNVAVLQDFRAINKSAAKKGVRHLGGKLLMPL